MNERYCPSCHQNAVMDCPPWGCMNCGAEHGVLVDPKELEELVKALDWTNEKMDAWSYDETILEQTKQTAAKFRGKYLKP